MPKLTREQALANLNLSPNHVITQNSQLKEAYANYIKTNPIKDKTLHVQSVAALLPKKPTTIEETLRSFADIFFEHEPVSNKIINSNIATSPSELSRANTDAKININCMSQKLDPFARQALSIPNNNSPYREWQIQYCLLAALGISVDLNHFYNNLQTNRNLQNNKWAVFYKLIYEKILWANLTAEQGIVCLEFLHGKDAEKLCEAFELINSTIKKKTREEKELTSLREELIDKIAGRFNPRKEKNELIDELFNIVENKIEKTGIFSIAYEDILDFLRKIAGILLVICGLGMPLCYPPFRSYFFESRPAEESSVSLELLNNISRSLQPQR